MSQTDETTILIVEDNSLTSMELESMMDSWGYNSLKADSGGDALKIIQDICPDLVLVDIVLKGKMDGIELVKKIKAKLDVPIIFLSSHTDGKTMEKVKFSVPNNFLTKPINEHELKFAIEIALVKKELEDKLKRSEQKYRLISENTADVIWILDLNTNKFTYVSPSVYGLMGYTPEEILEQSVDEIMTHESYGLVLEEMKKIRPNIAGKDYEGSGQIFKIDMLQKSGSIVPTEVKLTLITDENGNISQIQGVSRNMSKSLKIKEEKNRLFNYSIDMLCVTGFDGYFKELNHAWEQTLGWTIDELMSKPYIEFVHPDDKNNTLEIQKELLKGENVIGFDNRFLTKEGSFKWISWNIYSLAKEALTFSIARDVTDIKNTKNKLEETNRKLNSIIESSPDTITITDLDLNIIDCNNATVKIFDADSKDEIIGLNALKMIDPDDRQKLLNITERAISKKESVNFELNVHKVDKTEFPAEISGNIILDSMKTPKSLIWIIKDITERKNAEKKIKQSLEEKELLMREIHHRVKNNLMIISSLLNLQSEYIKDDNTLNIFKESQNRTRSMALIHEQLYQSNDLKNLNFKKYIEKLSNNIITSYQPDTTTIKLEMDIEEIMLDVDNAIPLGLILNELVSNSMKHAFPHDQSHAKIFISLKRTPKGLLIMEIKDNGIGIPEDLDIYNTDSLGLKIVNTLVSQIEGTMNIENNSGTAFQIIFNNEK